MAAEDKKRRLIVLLVDDQPLVASSIREMLADEQDIDFHHCASALQALGVANKLRPTVILQDLVMPDMDGFSAVRFFRANSQTANTPIIVLSSKEDPRDKSRAFGIGASDYLVKLPDKVELVARVRAHSRSYLAQIERDDAYRALESLKAELESANAELQRLTVLDPLTGLANRRRLEAALIQEWDRCERESQPLSVVLVDVDEFKKYNDTYGHLGGDECLRQIAQALAVGGDRPARLVARYGGEEFVLVLSGMQAGEALAVAESVRTRVVELAIPHTASVVANYVTLSFGIASCLPKARTKSSIENLLAAADSALYDAKQSGRNRCKVARMDAAFAVPKP